MALVPFNKFPAAAHALHEAVAEVIEDTTIALAEDAKAAAPIATGFLWSSIYRSTWNQGSTYGNAGSPPGDSYLLPETGSTSDLEGIVAVAANYGIYVELGHHTRSGSWVPPQPYFYPAVDMARNTLDNELNSIEPRIAGMIG